MQIVNIFSLLCSFMAASAVATKIEVVDKLLMANPSET